jgi:NADP-dependent 3-hydroxy acid dehydrogenase YdfG
MTRFVTQLSGTHVLVTGMSCSSNRVVTTWLAHLTRATSGGNKGIGKVIVESFLAEGANVSYCGRTARGDELNDFADAKDGARAVGTKVDLGHPDEIKAWVEASAKDFERIDAVIANGTYEQRKQGDGDRQGAYRCFCS